MEMGEHRDTAQSHSPPSRAGGDCPSIILGLQLSAALSSGPITPKKTEVGMRGGLFCSQGSAIGQEVMVSSCVRGRSDWLLGENPLSKENSALHSCPGVCVWGGHPGGVPQPCRCGTEGHGHSGLRLGLGVSEVISNLKDSTVL